MLLINIVEKGLKGITTCKNPFKIDSSVKDAKKNNKNLPFHFILKLLSNIFRGRTLASLIPN